MRENPYHSPIQRQAILNQDRFTSSTDVKYTETTRYLCAAAHLNSPFRNYVLEHIVEEEYRAIGESFGADMVSVVRHCLAVRQREMLRDLALLLPLVILVISIIAGFALWIPCFIVACI